MSDLGLLGKGSFPVAETARFTGMTYVAPGKRIDIDRSSFNGTDDRLEQIFTHEIGHNLGLRHSDWNNRRSCGGGGESTAYGAVHIAGTPTGFDAKSVMNACIPDNGSGEFSYYDRVALRRLYR